MYHLFFDLDGTLTDPAPGITGCLVYAAQRLGRSTLSAIEMRRYIGPPLRDAFAEILETQDRVVIEEAVRLYRDRFSTVGLFENAVYPGVECALEQLSAKGFTLAVVTSKPAVYANRIIDHFRLRRFFHHVYGSELSGERSHKSELVGHALVGEVIEAPGACMIGDRSHDVLGAVAHGVAALGVCWGYGTEEELRGAGADRVIATVEQLVPACCELRTQQREQLTRGAERA